MGAYGQADYVLVGGRLYTVDPAQPIAEAMAVQGERILMVGTSEQVLAAYPNAQRIDLDGYVVVPGFIDAHAHLMGLGLNRMQADLTGTRSVQEVLERLKAFATSLPEGAWLLGRGWDQNDWPVKAFPTRYMLDAAFPDRPVWLVRIDGHAAWANTAALQQAAPELLATFVADPPGGRIVRDAQGIPTGVFIDAAMELVARHIPRPTEAVLEEALQRAVTEVHRYGLTGVHDAGADWDTIQRYRRAIDRDALRLRLYVMVDGLGEAFDRICTQGPLLGYKGYLTVRSVKFYIDGALGSRGAALLAEYSDDPENQGLLRYAPEVFAEMVQQAMRCGLQVNTHAIGDRGVRVVLDAYEQALQTLGRTAGRHRVEHAQVIAPPDFARFAALGVIASMQPTHAISDMYWAEDRLGPERVRGAYAWRTLLRHGARLAFGSDFPVESPNPLLGFYAAVTRQDAQGWPPGGWYPEERLTREEALRAFTLGAAYAAFQEDELGSLTPGKYADFVVLSQDIMTIPPEEILQTQVLATFVGGQCVFHHEAAAGLCPKLP
ncbi:N-substituted formamide deformylase [bacterium HR18]|nr:N-substituted formamide deformylase [bacterium HR18]